MNLDKVLMCPPTYFDIEYCINPWMDPNNRVDKSRALDQWNYVREALVRCGVKIEYIEPVEGLPDMTFSGDCGIISQGKFLASNFRFQERQGEVAPYTSWLRAHDYQVFTIPENVYFEGLGDIIYHGDDILFGYGPRSSAEAITYVRDVFPEFNIIGELYLKHPDFYHTALGVALLDTQTVIYYREAITEDSARFLHQNFANVISVSDEDARKSMICNNIVVGRTILVDNCTHELERQLNLLKFEVIRCDMSEFKKSGGSIRCLIVNL